MTYLAKIDDQWIPLQSTVFARWVSTNLGDVRKEPIQDLTKDLSDGVALVELAEILTHKKAPNHWAEHPKHNVEKVTNCDMAIDMFEKDGVRFVGISGKDVSDSNQKLVLGLVWSLILHYSINKAITDGSDKVNGEEQTATKNQQKELINWANERTSNYPNVDNFTPYDLGMCALLDTYYPEKINYHNLDFNDHQGNAQLACDVMKEVGVPVYVYPEDLSKNNDAVDSKTLMVQLAAAKEALDRQPTIPSSEITEETDDNNDSLTDIDAAQNDINTGVEVEEKAFEDNAEHEVGEVYDPTMKHVKVHVGIENEHAHNEGHKKNIRIHVRRNDGGVRVGDIEQTDVNKTKFTLLPTENDVPENLEGQDIKIRVKRHGNVTEKIVHAPYRGVQIVVNNKTGYEERVQVIPENGETTRNVDAHPEESDVNDSKEINQDPKVTIDYSVSEEQMKASEPVATPTEEPPVTETKEVQLGDNSQYSGRKFSLVMKLKGAEYNNGKKVNGVDNADGPEVTLALAHVPDTDHFINDAGQKLDLQPIHEGDDHQQFVFGLNEWNTVIDSVHQRGMVWDVCDQFDMDPPDGTPYYLFPFHGRHNQHFVFQNNHIYATQNGDVVTYVGGDIPFVMMNPSDELAGRQTFYITLL